MRSLNTRTKLLVAFVAVALGSAVVGAFAFSASRKLVASSAAVTKKVLPALRGLAQVHEGMAAMRYHTTKAIAGTLQGDQQKLETSWALYEEERKRTEEGMSLFASLPRSPEEEARWGKIVPGYDQYLADSAKIWEAVRAGDGVKADGIQNAVTASVQAGLVGPIAELVALQGREAARLKAEGDATARSTQALLWSVVAVTLLAGIGLGVYLALAVSRSLDFLVGEALRLRRAVEQGRLSVRGETARVPPELRPIVEGMNAIMEAYARPIRVTAECVDRLARGDLPPRLTESYEGDFDLTKRNLNTCIDAVNALVADATMLAEAAVRGELSRRADPARHQGDFRRIVAGVNGALDAVMGPVEEASRALQQLAARDLRARVDGSYQGDHARMKEAVNATAQALHDALAQVSEAAQQVSSASRQIASSSQAVAGGASEQASALEETSSSLETMASSTRRTAQSAEQASALAGRAKGAADEGSAAMGHMTEAMEKIKRSAEGTSQIIKDINEITFQTNLLALNAAVEAARAGEAGRGFAVVAEEVRSLAQRSKAAASKTEELIRQSVREAGQGELAAQRVHGRLTEIVSSVSQVTEIVTEIAASAQGQAAGIDQVTRAVAEVGKVTQQNAASAEESSSAAAELTGQSRQLAVLLESFALEAAAPSPPPAAPRPRGASPPPAPRRPAAAGRRPAPGPGHPLTPSHPTHGGPHMRSRLTHVIARLALAIALGAAGPAAAEPVKVRFTLDWKPEGPAALFLLAAQNGWFAAEGLDVTIDPGNGSAGAVNRVASGAYELGLADLNALIDFDARNPGQAMKAVYMVYNHPPYAIIALKKSGIARPADLAGRKLGAPGFDAARKTWPAFAERARLPKDGVSWISMDPALRESMLVKGQVDAISGFAFTSVLNLGRAGVPASDLVVFSYADLGVKLYGNAVVVSPKFAAAHPEQVKAFLRAVNRSVKAVAADPRAGIKALKAHDPSIDEELELKRLKLALTQNVLTPDVLADGLGGVRPARLASALEEVATSFGLPGKPRASDVFDAGYLPPAPDRAVAR